MLLLHNNKMVNLRAAGVFKLEELHDTCIVCHETPITVFEGLLACSGDPAAIRTWAMLPEVVLTRRTTVASSDVHSALGILEVLGGSLCAGRTSGVPLDRRPKRLVIVPMAPHKKSRRRTC